MINIIYLINLTKTSIRKDFLVCLWYTNTHRQTDIHHHRFIIVFRNFFCFVSIQERMKKKLWNKKNKRNFDNDLFIIEKQNLEKNWAEILTMMIIIIFCHFIFIGPDIRRKKRHDYQKLKI